MKTRRDTLILLAGVPAITMGGQKALAGTVAGFGGSTEFTQILNNAQLLGTVANTATTAARLAANLINQATQIANQIAAYRNMIQNTLSLPDQLWGQITGDLDDLYQIIISGKGLSNRQGTLDQAVRDQYWSYDDYVDSDLDNAQIAAHLTKIDTDLDEDIATHMQILGLTEDHIKDSGSRLKTIQSRLSTANGTNAILKESAAIGNITAASFLQFLGLFKQQSFVTTQYAEVERDRKNKERAKGQQYFTGKPTQGNNGN